MITTAKATEVLNAVVRDEYARLAVLAGRECKILMIRTARKHREATAPFPLYNAQSGSEDHLAEFEAFALCPVRTEHDFYGEHMEKTTICGAEIWSIYGRSGLEWRLIHDSTDEHSAGTALVQIIAMTGKSVSFQASDYCTAETSLPALADILTSKIHDEIPGYDEPDEFKSDDFDNHPLAAIREDLVAALDRGV
ncbi:hypothetical protein [Cypionkella psychrotolerans]|uniref:hypothetical protein n=1 Tax=Cypionkella psychrotolerans TaxID=1678131 RepID=UPI0006B66C44|nr:hypothetical protein [Cypionkella psychrotolerans]